MKTQIARRLVFGLLALAALFFGWELLKEYFVDPGDKGHVETAGYIAAIENDGNGDRAVVFDTKGSKSNTPGLDDDVIESEIAWRPDGDRLFVMTNRQGQGFRPYRWNPTNDAFEPRMPGGTINMSAISYGPFQDSDANRNALIVAGGQVFLFDQRKAIRTQVLPPPTNDKNTATEDGESGSGAPITGVYATIGTAFTEARWGQARQIIWATMKREGGEVLIAQQLGLDEKGVPYVPIPLMAGRELQMDVAPDGTLALSIQGFAWVDPDSPEIPDQFRKDGKLLTPMKNGMAVIRWNTAQTPQVLMAFASPEDEALVDPSFSPDSSLIAACAGQIGPDHQFKGVVLLLVPAEEGGVTKSKPVYEGHSRMPSWSPLGNQLVFVGQDSRSRNVLMKVGADGSGITTVGEPGEYKWPKFSPQVPST